MKIRTLKLILVLVPLRLFAFDTIADSAFLIEQNTGQIIYQKQGDQVIPPASLTKLMTLRLTFEALKRGDFELDEYIPIPYEGTAQALPPFSSQMGLRSDMRVTMEDLIKGMSVMSGNDAANTLAITLGGSLPDFVEMMNAEAERLGLESTHFADPSGLSEYNKTTARDWAAFSQKYIADYPNSLVKYHSLGALTFPQEDNWIYGPPEGFRSRTKVNYNLLVESYPGADGLKTGYIDESGFNIAVTAKRGDFRLVGVVLGIHSEDYLNGVALRAQEARRLLDYGFNEHRFITPELPDFPPVRIWKGRKNWLTPAVEGGVQLVIPQGEEESLKGRFYLAEEKTAPIAEGTLLGTLVYTLHGEELGRFSLINPAPVPKGPWYKVLWHQVLLFFRDLI